MAASVANNSRKSRRTSTSTSASAAPRAGKNAAYRTNVASHEPINSKARINWFIFGSWSVILIMFLAFLAGVISLFM